MNTINLAGNNQGLNELKKDAQKAQKKGLPFIMSWLVICCVILSLISGNKEISVEFLIKLFGLCLWGVISFMVSFRNARVQKKGFIFSLTLFYVLFIPIEVIMFYVMGIFTGPGNAVAWIIFGIIIITTYLISLFVDHFVMKRNAEIYTQKMMEYVSMNRQ